MLNSPHHFRRKVSLSILALIPVFAEGVQVMNNNSDVIFNVARSSRWTAMGAVNALAISLLRRPGFAALLLGALLMVSLALANEPYASEPGIVCGQIITEDTTLTADLSCPEDIEQAIIIGASNITLDLGGHVLSSSNPAGNVNSGIVVGNVSGVTIKNGIIEEFCNGIGVFNTQRATVENLSIRNLRSTNPDDFVSGIGVSDSKAFVVRDSHFEFAPLIFHKTAVDVYSSDVTIRDIDVRGGGGWESISALQTTSVIQC
jgi:hypothetical protein